MKKPTIYEIKRGLTGQPGYNGHFFDRESLAFFGQTMAMFTVDRTTDPTIFRTCAPICSGGKRVRGAFSIHFWQWRAPNYFDLLIGTPEGIEVI